MKLGFQFQKQSLLWKNELSTFQLISINEIHRYLFLEHLKIRMVLLDQLFCDKIFVKITLGIQIV